MSLLSTLAKVAVGVAVAKGVSGMSAGKAGAGGAGGGAGTGSVFGGKLSPGNRPASGGAGGALGDLLKGGGLEDLLKGGGLGSVLSGRSGSGGGLGGLLEGLSNASRPSGGAVARPQGGSMGDLLNQSLDHFGEPDTPPTMDQEASAKVLLWAMLQAAKSDGRIDPEEKKNLLGQIGDISKDEMAFVDDVLARPVDVQALAREVPDHMAAQVYSMSLLAIDLDSKKEASYLHELAQALKIDPQDANAIHNQMGEPQLYS